MKKLFILCVSVISLVLTSGTAMAADINSGGAKIGNYDPTSLAMTFGVSYFFN